MDSFKGRVLALQSELKEVRTGAEPLTNSELSAQKAKD